MTKAKTANSIKKFKAKTICNQNRQSIEYLCSEFWCKCAHLQALRGQLLVIILKMLFFRRQPWYQNWKYFQTKYHQTDQAMKDMLMTNSGSQRQDPLQKSVLSDVYFRRGFLVTWSLSLMHCFSVFSFPFLHPPLCIIVCAPHELAAHITDMVWNYFIYYCWSKYPFTTYPKESHISPLSYRREKQDIESCMLSSLRPPS